MGNRCLYFGAVLVTYECTGERIWCCSNIDIGYGFCLLVGTKLSILDDEPQCSLHMLGHSVFLGKGKILVSLLAQNFHIRLERASLENSVAIGYPAPRDPNVRESLR